MGKGHAYLDATPLSKELPFCRTWSPCTAKPSLFCHLISMASFLMRYTYDTLFGHLTHIHSNDNDNMTPLIGDCRQSSRFRGGGSSDVGRFGNAGVLRLALCLCGADGLADLLPVPIAHRHYQVSREISGRKGEERSDKLEKWKRGSRSYIKITEQSLLFIHSLPRAFTARTTTWW